MTPEWISEMIPEMSTAEIAEHRIQLAQEAADRAIRAARLMIAICEAGLLDELLELLATPDPDPEHGAQ